jgi:hypothetical protein
VGPWPPGAGGAAMRSWTSLDEGKCHWGSVLKKKEIWYCILFAEMTRNLKWWLGRVLLSASIRMLWFDTVARPLLIFARRTSLIFWRRTSSEYQTSWYAPPRPTQNLLLYAALATVMTRACVGKGPRLHCCTRELSGLMRCKLVPSIRVGSAWDYVERWAL